ncbi:ABC transporter permease [Synoicihabitans lomoniglobus]|uniref:ABC transporter permease n=1 Tax=Synoicihabitans lomoniglobus TaxID=2909285 RepID=A0AAF0CN94_9BACT|nr:ABC transporter permease [Opitutaceae bacterium LMO-M01]WED64311.1 ABC transporter permease [Opitutaceae bacterium LMO-M01]
MFSDFRAALRALNRARGFTSITILTLALGMGSATAIFSVVDWVLFRSIDYPPGLVSVGRQFSETQFIPSISGIVAEDFETRSNLFAKTSMAAVMLSNVVLDDQPVGRGSIGVTKNLMSMLEIKPTRGRGFLPDEFSPGQNNVVIVTHRFWQSKLAGDAAALGQTLLVGDTICTIVGILGRDQTMPSNFGMGVLRPHQAVADPSNPWSLVYFFFGQLQPGQTPATVQTELTANPPQLSPRLQRQVWGQPPGVRSLDRVSSWLRPEYYRVMLGAVAFLYAIACLNATNLIVVRRLRQARELSIRLALGAGRWGIIRLNIIESILLVSAGAIAALVVANTMLPLLLSLAGATHTTDDDALWRLDHRAGLILLALTFVTAAIITIIPFVRTMRARPQTHLKESSGALGESRGLARLRGGLVVLQIAAALILLTGAGLMVRTFHNLQATEPGFTLENRWKISLMIPPGSAPNVDDFVASWHAAKARLEQIPGVESVGYGSDFIMSGHAFSRQGIEAKSGDPLAVAIHFMDTDYLPTAGLQLVQGRNIDPAAPHTEVLINESLAQLRWPYQNPIGQLVRPIKRNRSLPTDEAGLQVVGIIRDVRATPRLACAPSVYRSIENGPFIANHFILQTTTQPPPALAETVRRELYALNPDIIVFNATGFSDLQQLYLRPESMVRSVLQVLAVIATTLTAIGIFALLAFSVNLRRGEFGVRLALGATSQHLVRLVIGQGFRLAVIGVLAGLAGAWALVHYLESLLFGTTPYDPAVFIGVTLGLFTIALLACLIPAIRATRINIALLLRSE